MGPKLHELNRLGHSKLGDKIHATYFEQRLYRLGRYSNVKDRSTLVKGRGMHWMREGREARCLCFCSLAWWWVSQKNANGKRAERRAERERRLKRLIGEQRTCPLPTQPKSCQKKGEKWKGRTRGRGHALPCHEMQQSSSSIHSNFADGFLFLPQESTVEREVQGCQDVFGL